jgi:ABC-2 type transport system permease protein
MNKVLLIIQREYLSRVKKKSFLLITILAPIAILALGALSGFMMSRGDSKALNIAVVDKSNLLKKTLTDEKNMYFKFTDESIDSLKKKVSAEVYNGILEIPNIKDINTKEMSLSYYSDDVLGLETTENIEDKIADAVKSYKIDSLKLDRTSLDALKMKISIDPEPIKEDGKNDSKYTSSIAAGIGAVSGFLMYFIVLIFGSMVMRSVMEEKTNRIVEVIISSVKPFQLMLGKIIGVGLVGLTQFVIWGIIMAIGNFILAGYLSSKGIDPSQMGGMGKMGMAQSGLDQTGINIAKMLQELGNMNWWMIIPLFLFYFLGGYFLYASLFAAVGSAVGEDASEAQGLSIPITIPVVLGFYMMMSAIKAPDSTLAVWSSIFPLFSPLVMPARLPFNPPAWQIIASMVSLVLGVIAIVWLAGRIYRVGILMYGKKVTIKELGKWLFYKD